MKLLYELEDSDRGTPIEKANAIIKSSMGGANYDEEIAFRKRELAEIAEHIQVFLRYCEV